jgi:hypothetical protein
MANGTLAVKEEKLRISRNERREILKTTDALVARSMKSAVTKMRFDIYSSCSTVSARTTIAKVSRIAEDFEAGAFMEFGKAWDKYQNALSLAKSNPSAETGRRYYRALDTLANEFNSAINDYAESKSKLWLGWPNLFINSADLAGYALIPFTIGLGGIMEKGFAKAAKAITKKYAGNQLARPLAQELIKKEIKHTVNMAFNTFFALSISGSLGSTLAKDLIGKPSAAKQAIDMSSFATMVLKDRDATNRLCESMRQIGALAPEAHTVAFEDKMMEIANPPLDIGKYMSSVGMQVALLALINRNAMLKGAKKILQRSGTMSPATVAKLRYSGL